MKLQEERRRRRGLFFAGLRKKRTAFYPAFYRKALLVVLAIGCIASGIHPGSVFLLTAHLAPSFADEGAVTVSRYMTDTDVPLSWCTQVHFNRRYEVVVNMKDNNLYYRKHGASRYTRVSLQLSNPHAIAWSESGQCYYVCDTENNRILVFRSLERPEILATLPSLAGTKLIRPHDIAIDEDTGWIYIILPEQARVIRFRGIGRQAEQLDLSPVLGYSRSLTFAGGRLYVIGSSLGRVVEVVDFEKSQYLVYQAPGSNSSKPLGNWERTGLVLNDVAYHNNAWYATSYFCQAGSLPGQDYNVNKVIRFATWSDFQSGRWDDLSHHFPGGLVPYYLTTANRALYIPLFNHSTPGEGDSIFVLTN